jgi:SAM-dependent methyltransferase
VVAIERDPRQLARARSLWSADAAGAWTEGRLGELMDAPLERGEWGSFDLVHARFVLEHVPDPAGLTRVLVAAARPGGRIVLADDDHDVLRLHPPAPGLERVWRAYVGTYAAHGNDPSVGRKLPALLAGAGAAPVRCEWIFFGACAGEPRFPAVVENLRGILAGARAAIGSGLAGGAAAVDRGIDELRRWAELPGAALWYALCWAEGRRP